MLGMTNSNAAAARRAKVAQVVRSDGTIHQTLQTLDETSDTEFTEPSSFLPQTRYPRLVGRESSVRAQTMERIATSKPSSESSLAVSTIQDSPLTNLKSPDLHGADPISSRTNTPPSLQAQTSGIEQGRDYDAHLDNTATSRMTHAEIMKGQLLSQMKGSTHDLKAALVENFSNQIDILIQQHIVAVERCLDDTLKTLECTAVPPQTPQQSVERKIIATPAPKSKLIAKDTPTFIRFA